MLQRRVLVVLSGDSPPWYLSGGVAPAACIAVYKPVGAASYAASKVNLINPGTYNAVDGTAYPTWDATNGWTFVSANSQYLDTTIVPATNIYSIGVRFSASSNTHLCSAYTAASRNIQITRDSFNYPNGQTGSLASGVKFLTPVDGYHNGAALGLSFTGWTSTNTRSFFVGARNIGTPDGYLQGTIKALVIYNTTLTPAQVLAISTAMAALT